MENPIEAPERVFEDAIRELRPKLHRYCARMTGSVIDGEDVLQDALVKAFSAFPRAGTISNLESWLFRIAHNAALDYLRKRARHNGALAHEDVDPSADPLSVLEDRETVADDLRTFMRLPLVQRSSVILMDVLGYSLQDIAAIMDSSVPAVKSALHRGRQRLAEIANEPEDFPSPVLDEHEVTMLNAYVDRFNARDFDAIRRMIADEVRLELVNKTRMNGRAEVQTYFSNYDGVRDWYLRAGTVEGRAAALVYDRENSPTPQYFILLEWNGERLTFIRDFRYARYVADGAETASLVISNLALGRRYLTSNTAQRIATAAAPHLCAPAGRMNVRPVLEAPASIPEHNVGVSSSGCETNA